MATIKERLLGQARPSTTTAETIYTLPNNAQTVITSFRIANTGSGSVKFDVYFDNTSSVTYDESTAVLWEITLATGESYEENNENGIFFMEIKNSSIGVKTNTANDITFTFYGKEITQ